MDILSIDKLVLFLFFFVPGFISLKFYQLIFAEEKVDFSKSLYEAIGLSCINFSFFFWLIYYINRSVFVESHPVYYYLITLFVIFITPLILTWVLSKILKSKVFSRFFISPEKVPWDWHFSKREAFWILVTLKDGKRIGGKFGKDSTASTFPRSKEIYIEDVWKLDENYKFLHSIKRNKGALITGDSILSVEFFS